MALVQSGFNFVVSNTDATSFTNTFGFTATAGRLIVALAACGAGGNPVMSTAGWTLCMPTPASGRVGTWFKISDGTEDAFTVTTSITTGCSTMLLQYTGGSPTTPLDVSSQNSGTGTAWDTGPPTHPTAPDSPGVALAMFTATDDSATWTVGSEPGWAGLTAGYTQGTQRIGHYMFQKFITTSYEQQQLTMTAPSSVAWQSVLVSFKIPLSPNLPSPMQSVR